MTLSPLIDTTQKQIAWAIGLLVFGLLALYVGKDFFDPKLPDRFGSLMTLVVGGMLIIASVVFDVSSIIGFGWIYFLLVKCC